MSRSLKLAAVVLLLVGPASTEVAAAQEGGTPDAAATYIEFEDGHTGELVRIPVESPGEEVEAEPAGQTPTSQAPASQAPTQGSARSAPETRGRPGAGERGPPRRWARATRPPCSMRGRRRICDGPLRVPAPSGPALELAQRLRIGTRLAAGRMMQRGPQRAWVREVGGRTPRSILYPVPGGRLGRGVGYVRRGRNRHRPHNGVDIGARTGTPVVAANDGLVVYSQNEMTGYGNMVIIVHADGSGTFYAHLNAAYVQPGERVRRGERIGEVGDTGLASGPHLHFEWRVNGEPRDPTPRFQR